MSFQGDNHEIETDDSFNIDLLASASNGEQFVYVRSTSRTPSSPKDQPTMLACLTGASTAGVGLRKLLLATSARVARARLVNCATGTHVGCSKFRAFSGGAGYAFGVARIWG